MSRVRSTLSDIITATAVWLMGILSELSVRYDDKGGLVFTFISGCVLFTGLFLTQFIETGRLRGT